MKLDSPWVALLSAAYIFAVALFLTWANYAHFDLEKDVRMALLVAVAYAAQNVGKRRIRKRHDQQLRDIESRKRN